MILEAFGGVHIHVKAEASASGSPFLVLSCIKVSAVYHRGSAVYQSVSIAEVFGGDRDVVLSSILTCGLVWEVTVRGSYFGCPTNLVESPTVSFDIICRLFSGSLYHQLSGKADYTTDSFFWLRDGERIGETY